jgi:hypothetical protein
MTITVSSMKTDCIDSIHFNPVKLFLADETPANHGHEGLIAGQAGEPDTLCDYVAVREALLEFHLTIAGRIQPGAKGMVRVIDTFLFDMSSGHCGG